MNLKLNMKDINKIFSKDTLQMQLFFNAKRKHIFVETCD